MIRYLLFMLLFLGLNFTLTGQKLKSKKSKYSKQTQVDLLEEARGMSEKNPAQAIKTIESLIRQENKKGNRYRIADAYILLGNIYEQIDQKELALERYQRAVNSFQGQKKSPDFSEVYYKMGLLQLDLKQAQEAEYSFTICIEQAGNKELVIQCEEGLADVALLQNDYGSNLSQLDMVQQKVGNDSLALARLEAKRSLNYSYQNDAYNANQSLINSVNTLPRSQTIDDKSYAPIQQAQEEVLALNELNNLEEIEIRKMKVEPSGNITPPKLPKISIINENLKIADRYEAENNLPEATKHLDIAKSVIDDKTEAISVAEVYKKSAELNEKRGNLTAALADFDRYIIAKEKAIVETQKELAEQIEIVKGQQQIDLLERDFVLAQKDQDLLQSRLQIQNVIIGLLTLLLMALVVFFYFLYRNVKAKRRANQMLLLKSLRTQMNPHFIFNALNSVNNFIAKNDEKAANKFLSNFSRLMRKVLDYSKKDFIAFEEEIELNELYLKLEHFRFRDKFDYTFEKQDGLNIYDLEVPPMLIQPFIENAVWHGLRYKEGRGTLQVQLKEVDNHLLISIKDDGIGRVKSKALKTTNQRKYKSTGLDNVSQRIALINEIYQKNYQIEVVDAYPDLEETGTLVNIRIPK